MREFVLNYRVSGVVRREDAGDVLAWRATPGDHRYHIRSSTIEYELPVPAAAVPEVRTRRTDQSAVAVSGTRVRIEAGGIRPNGWIDTTLTFDHGRLITAPPQWQQQAEAVAARSPVWMLASGIVAAGGLILLFAWWQGYDAPPRGPALLSDRPERVPPGDSAPAIAGVLAANGRVKLEHAVAGLFSLADRGELEISEKPRRAFSSRDFVLTRRRGADRGLAPHDRAMLDIVFNRDSGETSVTLSQARSRLGRHLRLFSSELHRELIAGRLVDPSRKAARDRFNRAAVVFLIVGVIAFAPVPFVVSRHGGWPLLIPGAILLVALTSALVAAAMTPLSNEGVRRAIRWRAYRDHVRGVATGKQRSRVSAAPEMLPLAVSLGLAAAWAKHLKREGQGVPHWFHALDGLDAHSAFSAFVVSGGAGASGGGVSSGGVAGGGASGAR